MIYVLEDDAAIRELVCYSLEKTGNPVKGFERPSDFYRAAADEVPTLLLLDVMLPEEDGLTVLRRIRADARLALVPVIMLTARDSEFDKVTALDLGADDYVTKPFGVMELVSRVKALLRRTARTSAAPSLTVGTLSLSKEAREVLVAGERVELTHKEFDLISYLLENRGLVLDRETILSAVWGYSFDGENRTVDVHIRSLRQKLGDGADCIETVRGVGYVIRK